MIVLGYNWSCYREGPQRYVYLEHMLKPVTTCRTKRTNGRCPFVFKSQNCVNWASGESDPLGKVLTVCDSFSRLMQVTLIMGLIGRKFLNPEPNLRRRENCSARSINEHRYLEY